MKEYNIEKLVNSLDFEKNKLHKTKQNLFLTTYEIEVTIISNPTTNSAIYIGIGLILILILGTCTYIFYRVKRLD